METLDLVSVSSLLAKRIDAKFVGFLLGDVVWSDLLKTYYCFDETSKMIYLVPLNLNICGGRYTFVKLRFEMWVNFLSSVSFYSLAVDLSSK